MELPYKGASHSGRQRVDSCGRLLAQISVPDENAMGITRIQRDRGAQPAFGSSLIANRSRLVLGLSQALN